jgi:hypothetical protein
VKTGLTLLGQCKALFRFWNYAFDTLVYLINRMPTLVLANRSPFDCLFQRSPDYHFLRTFGCLCFPFLRPYYRTCAASWRSSTLSGKMECGHIWQMWRGNEFLPLINKIWTGSRHLVFWLLETLTGLRDRVRRLIV